MVKQDGSEITFKGRFDEPPHVLIAAESMAEHHGSFARSPKMNIVSFDYAHNVPFRPPHHLSCRFDPGLRWNAVKQIIPACSLDGQSTISQPITHQPPRGAANC